MARDTIQGITPVYLVTDHIGFYERYGWEFLCMVQGDGEPNMTKILEIRSLECDGIELNHFNLRRIKCCIHFNQ